MSYRDERDALRQRVDNLEQALSEAQQQPDPSQRLAELTQQAAEARRLLDHLDAEIAQVRRPPGRSKARLGLVLGAGFVITLGIGLTLGRRLASAPPVTPTAAPHPRLAPPPPPPVATTTALPEVVPPPTAEPAAKPPPPSATARWSARVTRATGAQVGSSCLVEATLGGGASIDVRRLVVRCAGRVIHDSESKLEGMSMSGYTVTEELGERDGTRRYALVYKDQGSRSGERSQIALDSVKAVGAVWSDDLPGFRVELALPYLSEPVSGAALLDVGAPALRLAAVVEETTGPAPLAKKAACELRVNPVEVRGKCLVRLGCSGRMVYGKGTQGIAGCTLEGGAIVKVSDEDTTGSDGDPALGIAPAAGTMTLSDETGGKKWTATFRLGAR